MGAAEGRGGGGKMVCGRGEGGGIGRLEGRGGGAAPPRRVMNSRRLITAPEAKEQDRTGFKSAPGR